MARGVLKPLLTLTRTSNKAPCCAKPPKEHCWWWVSNVCVNLWAVPSRRICLLLWRRLCRILCCQLQIRGNVVNKTISWGSSTTWTGWARVGNTGEAKKKKNTVVTSFITKARSSESRRYSKALWSGRSRSNGLTFAFVAYPKPRQIDKKTPPEIKLEFLQILTLPAIHTSCNHNRAEFQSIKQLLCV